MGKQSKSKKAENLGKGKVTAAQVAFMVERYLSDNNFSETRSIFRNEASSLISTFLIREAPKSLLTLGAILDEYICLKEQKVIVEQEKARLEQEKIRVHSLLQGMQSVMNAYNANATASVPMINHANATKSPALVPPGPHLNVTPTVIPASGPSNSRTDRDNYSLPVTSQPLTRSKRTLEVVTEVPAAAKKTCGKLTSRKSTTQGTEKFLESDSVRNVQATNQLISGSQSSPPNCAPYELAMNVPSPPNNSSVHNTPPQAISSQSNKSMTPQGGASSASCSHSNSPQEITPTNCTIISTERVIVSPLKQMACYTIERNHCFSSFSPVKTTCLKRPGMRDHVKSRLDFDGSDAAVDVDKPNTNETSTSESGIDADLFDLNFSNLDAFGANFNFAELLVDFDLGCEGIGYPFEPTMGASADALSGSNHESGDGNQGANQVMSEISSTVAEVLSEKGMNAQGPDTYTSVKSMTKCITILSPAKG